MSAQNHTVRNLSLVVLGAGLRRGLPLQGRLLPWNGVLCPHRSSSAWC